MWWCSRRCSRQIRSRVTCAGRARRLTRWSGAVRAPCCRTRARSIPSCAAARAAATRVLPWRSTRAWRTSGRCSLMQRPTGCCRVSSRRRCGSTRRRRSPRAIARAPSHRPRSRARLQKLARARARWPIRQIKARSSCQAAPRGNRRPPLSAPRKSGRSARSRPCHSACSGSAGVATAAIAAASSTTRRSRLSWWPSSCSRNTALLSRLSSP
mmetsp:Transcript_9341/g.38293  ORF Transcript_9341/g.38293 Transcript_9341/m.38293 type:complete len:212 (+) Transcript_9341:411-1046(+)